MNLTKQKLAGAIGIAVDEARENPSLDAADIVNSVFKRVVEEVGDADVDPQVKAAAHKRLHAAADGVDQLGNLAETPLINALIGIGLAILSGGEDAKAFYAAFLSGGTHGG